MKQTLEVNNLHSHQDLSLKSAGQIGLATEGVLTSQPVPQWEAKLEQGLWQAWQLTWSYMPQFAHENWTLMQQGLAHYGSQLLKSSTVIQKTAPMLQEACHDKSFWVAHVTSVLDDLYASSLPLSNMTEWNRTLSQLVDLVEPEMVSAYHLHWSLGELSDNVEEAGLPPADEVTSTDVLKVYQKAIVEKLKQNSAENYLADMAYWLERCLSDGLDTNTLKDMDSYYSAVMSPSRHIRSLEKLLGGLVKLKQNAGNPKTINRLDELLLVLNIRYKHAQIRAAKINQGNDVSQADCNDYKYEYSESNDKSSNIKTSEIKNLEFSWDLQQSVSSIFDYISTYPAQAMTWVLLLQITAVAAFKIPQKNDFFQDDKSDDALTVNNGTLARGVLSTRFFSENKFDSITVKNPTPHEDARLLTKRELELFNESPWLYRFEFNLNSDIASTRGRNDPKITPLNDQTVLLSWWGAGPASQILNKVYLRRLLLNGTWVDNQEFSAGSFVEGSQGRQVSVQWTSNVVLLAWEGIGPGSVDNNDINIYVRRLGTNGTWIDPVEVLASNYTQGFQVIPSITAMSDEVALIAWSGNGFFNARGSNIYCRRLSINGTWLDDKEAVVNTHKSGSKLRAKVGRAGNSSAVIAWHGSGSGAPAANYPDIYMRRLDINGRWLDAEERIVNTYTEGFQDLKDVCLVPMNDTVIFFWHGNGPESVSSTDWDIFVRRLGKDGNWLDRSEFYVNNFVVGQQVAYTIKPITEDTALLLFGSNLNIHRDIYFRRIFYNGTFHDTREILANENILGEQKNADAHLVAKNQVLVVWQSSMSAQLIGQFYNDNLMQVPRYYYFEFPEVGTSDISLLQNNNGKLGPTIFRLNEESIAVLWTSLTNSVSSDVYMSRFGVNGIWVDPSSYFVNNYHNGIQTSPFGVKVNSSTAVIGWNGHGPLSRDEDDYNVFVGLLKATQNRWLWYKRVNTYLSGAQVNPVITKLAEDELVIAWSGQGPDSINSRDSNIYYRRIKLTTRGDWVDNSELRANMRLSHEQLFPVICELEQQAVIFIWEERAQLDEAQLDTNIYMRTLLANGTWLESEERVVNSFTGGFQFSPTLTTLSNKTAIIAWTGVGPMSSSAQDFNIYFRRLVNNTWYDASELIANTHKHGFQTSPTLAKLNNVTVLMLWYGNGPSDSADSMRNVYIRRFNINGTWLDSREFRVNSEKIKLVNFLKISAVCLDENSALIAWEGASKQGGVAMKVVSFSPNTRPVFRELMRGNNSFSNSYVVSEKIDAANTSYNFQPATLSLDTGDFVVIWNSKKTINQTSTNIIVGLCYKASGTKYGLNIKELAGYSAVQPQLWQVSEEIFYISWHYELLNKSYYAMKGYNISTCSPVLGNFRILQETSSQTKIGPVTGTKIREREKFAIVWHTDNEIVTKIFNTNNNEIASAFLRKDESSVEALINPRITLLDNDDIFIAYEQKSYGRVNRDIVGLRYRFSNNLLNSTMVAKTLIKISMDGQHDNWAPIIASTNEGGYLSIWTSQLVDGSRSGILARVFDNNDQPKGPPFIINSYRNGVQESPSIAKFSRGFVVAWQSWGQGGPTSSDADVYMALMKPDGSYDTKFSSKIVNDINTNNQINPVAFGTNFPYVAWQTNHVLDEGRYTAYELRKNAIPYQIRIQRFDESLQPTTLEQHLEVRPKLFLHQRLTFIEDTMKRLSYKPLFITNRANVTVRISFPKLIHRNTLSPVAELSISPFKSVIPEWDVERGIWQVFGAVDDVSEILQNTFLEPALDFHGSFNATILIDDGLSQLNGWLFGQGTAVNDGVRYTVLPKQSLLDDESWRLDLNTQFVDPDCAANLAGVYNASHCSSINYELPDTVLWRNNRTAALQVLPKPNWLYISDGKWLNAQPNLSGEWKFNVTATQAGTLNRISGTFDLDVLPSSDNTSKIIGAAVGVSVGVIVLGAGAFLLWRYRKNKKDEKSRKGEGFANVLRKRLNLADLDNYDTVRGQFYLTTTRVLEDELIQHGATSEQLLENEFVDKVADAIQATISPSTTLLGYTKIRIKKLHDNAGVIAQQVMGVGATKKDMEVIAGTEGTMMEEVEQRTSVNAIV